MSQSLTARIDVDRTLLPAHVRFDKTVVQRCAVQLVRGCVCVVLWHGPMRMRYSSSICKLSSIEYSMVDCTGKGDCHKCLCFSAFGFQRLFYFLLLQPSLRHVLCSCLLLCCSLLCSLLSALSLCSSTLVLLFFSFRFLCELPVRGCRKVTFSFLHPNKTHFAHRLHVQLFQNHHHSMIYSRQQKQTTAACRLPLVRE